MADKRLTDGREVETIYRSVIDDTITKLAPEFENAGVSLQALARLQEVWTSAMLNMMRTPVLESQPALVGGQSSGSGVMRSVVSNSGVKGVVGRGRGAEEGKEDGRNNSGGFTSSMTSQPNMNDVEMTAERSGMQIDDPLRYTKDEKGGMVVSKESKENIDSKSTTMMESIESIESSKMMDGNNDKDVQKSSSNESSAQSSSLLQTLHSSSQKEIINPSTTTTTISSTGSSSTTTTDNHPSSSPIDESTIVSSSIATTSSSTSTLPSSNPSNPSTQIQNQNGNNSGTIDSDSESSDVSDEEEVDTSSWTNSLMSLYEEPTKRTKNKRTYKLVKGILNVDGKDYLFKSGKAEFDWK